MSPLTASQTRHYDHYLTSLDTAAAVIEVIRTLPDEHLPVKEFDQAFHRVFTKISDQVERGHLTLFAACELLDAIAGEP